MSELSEVLIPPADQRSCSKHGKPIMPYKWKRGHRKSGYSACRKEITQSPEAQARRAAQFDAGGILCPCWKPAQRSEYVRRGKRICSFCKDHPGFWKSDYKPKARDRRSEP